MLTKRVLIVDDDKNFLFSLKDGLSKYSDEIDLMVSTSAEEALALIERNIVDLIISDLRMERMDGLQLLTIVARKYPHVPFILMTAYGSPPIKEKAKRGGAIRYLEKPITIGELIGAIREVLNETETIMNVSIIDISQLIFLERKTCTLKIVSKENNKKGTLSFREGKLIYAKTDKFEGLEAAVEIFSWENVNIFIHENAVVEENANLIQNLEFIIIRALEQREVRAEEIKKIKTQTKETKIAFNYKKLVENLKEIPGYKAAAVFNINGEQVIFDALKDPDRVRKYFLQMTSLFVAGSRATEKTGAGQMGFIQTDSDMGKFLARRRKKFIIMILLGEDGNLALAKDALEEVSEKL